MIASNSYQMDKDGIFLRRIDFRDVELVCDWENNIEGWNMEEIAQPYSIYDIIVMVSEMQNVHSIKQIRYMICHESVQDAIGVADLTEMDFEEGIASVGILIADQAWRNKGYAKKALLLLEQEAKSWGIKRLRSTVLADNEASVHLFGKLAYEKLAKQEEGYVVQGTYINAIVFEKWLNA